MPPKQRQAARSPSPPPATAHPEAPQSEEPLTDAPVDEQPPADNDTSPPPNPRAAWDIGVLHNAAGSAFCLSVMEILNPGEAPLIDFTFSKHDAHPDKLQLLKHELFRATGIPHRDMEENDLFEDRSIAALMTHSPEPGFVVLQLTHSRVATYDATDVLFVVYSMLFAAHWQPWRDAITATQQLPPFFQNIHFHLPGETLARCFPNRIRFPHETPFERKISQALSRGFLTRTGDMRAVKLSLSEWQYAFLWCLAPTLCEHSAVFGELYAESCTILRDCDRAFKTRLTSTFMANTLLAAAIEHYALPADSPERTQGGLWNKMRAEQAQLFAKVCDHIEQLLADKERAVDHVGAIPDTAAPDGDQESSWARHCRLFQVGTPREQQPHHKTPLKRAKWDGDDDGDDIPVPGGVRIFDDMARGHGVVPPPRLSCLILKPISRQGALLGEARVAIAYEIVSRLAYIGPTGKDGRLAALARALNVADEERVMDLCDVFLVSAWFHDSDLVSFYRGVIEACEFDFSLGIFRNHRASILAIPRHVVAEYISSGANILPILRRREVMSAIDGHPCLQCCTLTQMALSGNMPAVCNYIRALTLMCVEDPRVAAIISERLQTFLVPRTVHERAFALEYDYAPTCAKLAEPIMEFITKFSPPPRDIFALGFIMLVHASSRFIHWQLRRGSRLVAALRSLVLPNGHPEGSEERMLELVCKALEDGSQTVNDPEIGTFTAATGAIALILRYGGALSPVDILSTAFTLGNDSLRVRLRIAPACSMRDMSAAIYSATASALPSRDDDPYSMRFTEDYLEGGRGMFGNLLMLLHRIEITYIDVEDSLGAVFRDEITFEAFMRAQFHAVRIYCPGNPADRGPVDVRQGLFLPFAKSRADPTSYELAPDNKTCARVGPLHGLHNNMLSFMSDNASDMPDTWLQMLLSTGPPLIGSDQ